MPCTGSWGRRWFTAQSSRIWRMHSPTMEHWSVHFGGETSGIRRFPPIRNDHDLHSPNGDWWISIGNGPRPYNRIWELNHSKFRWFVLSIVCLQSVSIWYCFDSVVILHDELMDKFRFTDSQHSILSSMAIFGSILSAPFSSQIISKYGISQSIIVSLLCSFCGHSLFAVSCGTMSFTAMLIGRTIYGVGAALNIICSLMVIHRYFDSKELATSFAVSFSVGRMGFVANDFTAIHFIDDQSTDTLQVTVWCGVALLFVALLATFYLMDGHRWRFRLRPISCGIATAAPESMNSNHSESAVLTLSPSDSGKSHLYSFRIGYWLLAVIGGLGFSLFSTWNVVANGVLSNRYGIHDEAERDWLLMIVYIVPLITAPLFGVILDKNGSFHLMLCFAGICGLIGHLVMKLDFEMLRGGSAILLLTISIWWG